MDLILDPQAWIALLTLTALELVLGIDNIIFIAILVAKLPKPQQEMARTIGISLAAITRIALLFSIVWVMRLTTPFFVLLGHEFSGRDLILIGGGLFLLGKSTLEIHERLESEEGHASTHVRAAFFAVVAQILLLDVIFSLDSVLTAVGIAKHVEVMVAAILIAVALMLLFAAAVSRFIEQHPTLKMLALGFLLLIGFALVAEGLDFHIPKGYIYFAMGFSVFIEFLNLRVRRAKRRPVQLRQPYSERSLEVEGPSTGMPNCYGRSAKKGDPSGDVTDRDVRLPI